MKNFKSKKPRMDRLCGDTCSYVCQKTWLNEARTNIGLSPTMGFLNENDSLAYFAIFLELSPGVSFTVDFLKTFSFPLIISWLCQGARKDILRDTLMFYLT